MNISKQVGNQAHLLVIEQSSKKLSPTYCREKEIRNPYMDGVINTRHEPSASRST